jgi:hypothetical protein
MVENNWLSPEQAQTLQTLKSLLMAEINFVLWMFFVGFAS